MKLVEADKRGLMYYVEWPDGVRSVDKYNKEWGMYHIRCEIEGLDGSQDAPYSPLEAR